MPSTNPALFRKAEAIRLTPIFNFQKTKEESNGKNLQHTETQPHCKKRLAELDRLFKRIYEDMVNGKLSEARFQMLSDDYEQEQADLRSKIEMLENEIQNQED